MAVVSVWRLLERELSELGKALSQGFSREPGELFGEWIIGEIVYGERKYTATVLRPAGVSTQELLLALRAVVENLTLAYHARSDPELRIPLDEDLARIMEKRVRNGKIVTAVSLQYGEAFVRISFFLIAEKGEDVRAFILFDFKDGAVGCLADGESLDLMHVAYTDVPDEIFEEATRRAEEEWIKAVARQNATIDLIEMKVTPW